MDEVNIKSVINIIITYSDLLTDVKRHLSIIGKRAQKVNGQSMFSDLTTSTFEDPVFNDFIINAAHNVISALADACSTYIIGENSVTFKIIGTRWEDTGTNPQMGLKDAIKGAVRMYIYNFTLAQYLSVIHPSTGEKYPPLYGQTYFNQCAVIMTNLKSLVFLKRPAFNESSASYSNLITTTNK